MSEHRLNDWISTADQMPPEGVQVLGFSKAWIDEDFNPEGMRECFLCGDGDDWNSAWWNDPVDQYETQCGRTGGHGAPTHWMPRPQPPKGAQDDHIMDAFVYGTGFMQDGKRVDHKDVYKQALPQGVEVVVRRIVGNYCSHDPVNTPAESEDCADCAPIIRDILHSLTGMAIVPVVGKDSFVQLVPDHCDRIVWRGSYHHLPLAATKEKIDGL